MIRRSNFGRHVRSPIEREAQREAARVALLASPGRAAVMGGELGPAQPKPVELRNRRLLDLAQNMPCLLLVPGVCNHRTDTTVACHSNLGIHGKAGARKADDHYSVWGCYACHTWLDTERNAPAELKAQVFMAAHLLQVLAWRQLAADSSTDPLDVKAIGWALNLLGATPIGALK